MSYYKGLSCPVCNEPFTNEEDIVVCPQCGLPHHRRCWTIENRCHEADKHGTPEQWTRDKNSAPQGSPSEPHFDGQICPNCSAKNAQYAEFCTRCGADLDTEDWHSAPVTPPPVNEYSPHYTPFTAAEHYSEHEIISNTPAKELAAVVGNNSAYYIPRFRRQNRNEACGWNWAACLFGPIWLLYRKQYVSGALLFLLDTACWIVYNFLNFSIQTNANAPMQISPQEMMANRWFMISSAALMLCIILRILLGILGNNLYLSACKKRIQKAKLQIPDISASELTSKGGVSFAVALVFYMLFQFATTVNWLQLFQ